MVTTKSKHRARSLKASYRPTKKKPPTRAPAKPMRPKPIRPIDTWLTILIKAFKHDYDRTLTYKEQELFSWILSTYPYYQSQFSTLQTHVRKTLNDYECFRNVGRGVWTYIDTRAPSHLQGMKLITTAKRVNNPSANPESNDGELEIQQDEQDDDDDADGVEIDKEDGDRDELETNEDIEINIMKSDLEVMATIAARRQPLKSPPASPPQTPIDESYRMSPEGWLNLLKQMFQNSRKQKTVREMTAWIRGNFPIYQKAPSDWENAISDALDSNSCFQRMGRGRWKLVLDDETPQVENHDISSTSSTEEEDWRRIGPTGLAFRRHSVSGAVSNYVPPRPRRQHHSFSSFQSSSTYVPSMTPVSTFRSTKPTFDEIDDDDEIEIESVRSTSCFDPRHSPLSSPPSSSQEEMKSAMDMVLETRLLPSDDRVAIEALALLCASNSPS
ncbi:hypothetical protein BC936DRAFT_141688 [Jimgerdemannia flammicorona]|uniref:Fork-head domain-containing protein n=1 Tax=Jimgerdemannia flammicorona TaxID=994334 RepID=A0A433DFT8_9FUNG|nr:hypothetical protein BC936DRAFT_141688 [Jimgerdemannia flammicorona]